MKIERKRTRNRERVIEEAIMASPESLDYPNALAIRNVRLNTNKRAGRLDVLLLPIDDPRKLVLVEAKVSTAPDADGKCIGQLLKYLSFALKIGTHGRERFVEYAGEHRVAAQSEKGTTPKQILGVRKESLGESLLHEGEPLIPQDIDLFIAIDGKSHGALPMVTETLREHFGLEVGIVIVENGQVRRM